MYHHSHTQTILLEEHPANLPDICLRTITRTQDYWLHSLEMSSLALAAAVLEQDKPYKIHEFIHISFSEKEKFHFDWPELRTKTLEIIFKFVQLCNPNDAVFEAASKAPEKNINTLTNYLADSENEYVYLRLKNTFASATRIIHDKKLLGNLSKEYKSIFKNYNELNKIEKEEIDTQARFIIKNALGIIIEKSPSPSFTHRFFENVFTEIYKPRVEKTPAAKIWSIIKRLAS
jgi:hypothetical protein